MNYLKGKATAHCKHILFFTKTQSNAEKNKKSLQSPTQEKN
jgi:hypothetical protein